MKRVENRSALFIQGIVVSFVAVVLAGCNGASAPENACRTSNLKASTVENASQACMIDPTDTETSTSTSTDAGTGGSTVTPGTGGAIGTGGTPGTGGSTSANAWQPTADCSESGPSSVDGAAGIQTGPWMVGGWTVCITKSYAQYYNDTRLRKVEGYGYKTAEFTDAGTMPPSATRYSGVIGIKCVLVSPVSVKSDGPDLQGNGVQGYGTGTFAISDGTTTAYLSPDMNGKCPFDYSYVP